MLALISVLFYGAFDMRIIYNNVLPFKGYSAINICGTIFARKSAFPLPAHTINHEKIHTAQMKELLFVFFYLAYVIEWLVKIVHYGNTRDAYCNISFEKEAYACAYLSKYLKNRKHFAQWRHTY